MKIYDNTGSENNEYEYMAHIQKLRGRLEDIPEKVSKKETRMYIMQADDSEGKKAKVIVLSLQLSDYLRISDASVKLNKSL